MKDFISSALPWLLMGLSLALVASGQTTDENPQHRRRNLVWGAALGLALGAVLTSLGLFENAALGLNLCAMLGLAAATRVRA